MLVESTSQVRSKKSGIKTQYPRLGDILSKKRNAIPAMISNGKFLSLVKFLSLEMLKDVLACEGLLTVS